MNSKQKFVILFFVTFFAHLGLSLYWIFQAIGCGASTTCSSWIKMADYAIGFPIFDFFRLFKEDGAHSSGEALFALLPLNSALVAAIVIFAWITFVPMVRRGNKIESSG